MSFLTIQKSMFITDFIIDNPRTLNVCTSFKNHEFLGRGSYNFLVEAVVQRVVTEKVLKFF